MVNVRDIESGKVWARAVCGESRAYRYKD
jgi:hypothetical protein